MRCFVRLAIVVIASCILAACNHDNSPSGTTPSNGGSGAGPSPPTYTVGVTVAGLGGTLVLQDSGVDSLTVTANGPTTFKTALSNGATYSVTVATNPAGQTCTVSNGTGTINGANVTNVTVSCTQGAAASVPTGGATIQAPPYSITFPANSFTSPVPVTASVTSDPTIAQRFIDGTVAFGASPILEGQEFQVTVQSTSAPTGYVTVSMPLSSTLSGQLASNSALIPLVLYLSPYSSDDADITESVDSAEPAASSFDTSTETASAQVPPAAFFQNPSGSYTAILKLILATAPSVLSTSAVQGSARSQAHDVGTDLSVSAAPQCTTAITDDGSGNSWSNPLNSQLQIVGPYSEPGHAGPMHAGIDFLANSRAVHAVRQGYIERVLWTSAGAYYVVVRHLDGTAATYLHLQEGSVMAAGTLLASALQDQEGSGFKETNPSCPQYPVARGDQLATSGDTGTTDSAGITHPHLHLEMVQYAPPTKYQSQKPLAFATSLNPIALLGTLSATFNSSESTSSTIGANSTDTVQLSFQDHQATPQEIYVRRSKSPNQFVSVVDRSAQFQATAPGRSDWPVLSITWSTPPSDVTLQTFDSIPPYTQANSWGIQEDLGQAKVTTGSVNPSGTFTVSAEGVESASAGTPPVILTVDSAYGLTPQSATLSFVASGLYFITDLGTLGGTMSTGTAINNSGQVTGFSWVSTANTLTHAFLYGAGSMQDLGTLAGGNAYSEGFAVNSSGQVTGETSELLGVTQVILGFLYSNGSMANLGNLGVVQQTQGYGINDSGEVVGSSLRADGTYHAFLYDQGAIQDLGTLPGGLVSNATGINAAGLVTGSSQLGAAGPVHAFVYANGSMQDLGTLPGGSTSVGVSINVSGTITGYADTTNGATHAFVYKGATLQDLGTPPGAVSSSSSGINANGDIVGNAGFANGNEHAFVYRNGVMNDLNNLLDPQNAFAPYITLTTATGINDGGWIVANGMDSRTGNYHAYLLQPSGSTVH